MQVLSGIRLTPAKSRSIVVYEVMSMSAGVYNVFRNTRFTTRNYECTNIAACIPVDDGAKVPDGYEVAPSAILNGMQPLWIEAGIQYWGWL